MKSVLFCRVSSKEQEETGYSLPAQEKLLTEYAKKNDFKITKVFSISESASGSKQRQIFSVMMTFVIKNKITVIICEKTDRLTRNFRDMVMIDQWLEKDENRQVHLVKDSLTLSKHSRSQEKLNWGIRILFAKNYIDNLSEEVKKGQKEKLAQGWLPTSPPVGYKTIGEKGHKIHIVDQEKKVLTKKMFELYDSGDYSLKRLTQVINEAGLRNANGNKIVKSRIHGYLTDPFYIGFNRWNGRLYPGKQETFISKDLFNRVQTRLKSKTTPKYRTHNFVFKSLVRCRECAGMITWEIQKGHVYGHCNHYRKCTQSIWVKEPDIVNDIAKILEKIKVKSPRLADWIKRALKDSYKDTITFYETSLNELSLKLKQIESRFEKIYDDKVDEKITEDFYNKKYNQYLGEKNEVTEAIKKHSESSSNFYKEAIDIYELSQKAKETFLTSKDIDKKRRLLRKIFKAITLENGVIDYKFTRTYEILSEAVRKTNGSKKLKQIEKEDEIFEPTKKTDYSVYSNAYLQARPILLAYWNDFRSFDQILKS